MFDTEFRPEQIHPSVFVGQGTAMVDASALQRYRPFIDDWPAFCQSLARSLPACIWTNSLRLTPEQLAEPLAADSLKLNAEYVWTYINRQELRVTVRQSQACTGLALYRPSPAGGALVESMYPKGCSPSKGKLVEV